MLRIECEDNLCINTHVWHLGGGMNVPMSLLCLDATERSFYVLVASELESALASCQIQIGRGGGTLSS